MLAERRRHIQVRRHIAQGTQHEAPGSQPRMRHGKPRLRQAHPVEYKHVNVQRPGRPCRRSVRGIRGAGNAAPTPRPLDPQRKRKQRPGVQTGPHRGHHIQVGRLRRSARPYMGRRFVDGRYGRHAHIPRPVHLRYAKAKVPEPLAEVRTQSKKRPMLLHASAPMHPKNPYPDRRSSSPASRCSGSAHRALPPAA